MPNPNFSRRWAPTATAVAVLLLLAAVPAAGAGEDDVETRTKRSRNGAGLRFGIWDVRGLGAAAGGSSSEGLAFEGYFQKGLDLHLAWESSLGFWQREQSSTESGPLGSETRQEVRSYVVPTLTALKFFPLTRPSDRVEPFLSAGLGLVLGIDRESTSSSDPLGPSGENTALHTGLGIKAGMGFDWHAGNAFGLTVGGRYQWAGFGEDVGGERYYEGLGADLGLTYRFQYD